MSEIEEIAKAVQSIADLGEKSVDASQQLGGFFARVFKEPISEISGMVHDKLRFVRWRRLLEISDEVNRILDQRDIQDTRAVPPKIGLPIFEEASLEEEKDLQSLWNTLLANSMDPNFDGELRYGFIDMIKNITATEATLLKKFYEILKRDDRLADLPNITNYHLKKNQLMQLLGVDETKYLLSVYNLMRMQCIAPAVLKGEMSFGDEVATIYKGVDAVVLTPLGVKFIEACIDSNRIPPVKQTAPCTPCNVPFNPPITGVPLSSFTFQRQGDFRPLT